MSAFFDTSVLVCCTDTTAPAKRQRAMALVAKASSGGEAVVSMQVLIELFHVLTHKQKVPAATAQVLTRAYAQWPVIDSDLALVHGAVEKSVQHRLSIWDAMVIEAALRAESTTLYTEVLGHGQRFGALAVVNPFLA